ncbi:hypothetical protein GGX14DRAFT_398482 [Mycena pura]|uniref:Uncharacterized protein n=1 Tax=Mycena pura TaxID=153505 RepID=A0AAD6V6J2_9AGAR|nr:hypothetical protein GGX14DRAFT_398482 [Mycena pura]
MPARLANGDNSEAPAAAMRRISPLLTAHAAKLALYRLRLQQGQGLPCCIRTLTLSGSKKLGSDRASYAQTVFEHAFDSYPSRVITVIYIPIGIFLVLYTFIV